ncbi:Nedd8-activating enzyme E1 catalytic subunit [Trichinella nelsoni]|uniref:Tyrosine--tRNA ligase n=1 Tax=Trichinella nelsoni TaxID=6336 RepID=A0A0V0S0A1_9BILA|nr:Nedd8-activating enzyme E1 catalytic subunit [Trichinella nelsoni]
MKHFWHCLRVFLKYHSSQSSTDVVEAIQCAIRRGAIKTSFPDSLLNNLESIRGVQPCIYAGFDPSSDSLHIGNLLIVCTLLRFHLHGFKIIFLVGSATSRLGDPSGRSVERDRLSLDEIQSNSQCIQFTLKSILRNFEKIKISLNSTNGLSTPAVLDNTDWYHQMNVLDFFDAVGRAFRLRHMMDKQCIRERIHREGMSYAEFSYQTLQAYDWLHLYEKFGCLLQIGGADQTGNIHSGHDLIRFFHNQSAYGLLVPLMLSSTGEKIGKSVGSSLWLSSSRTSSFVFYQYFLQLTDKEANSMMKLFSFCSEADLERILDDHCQQPEKRIAQRFLADQLTLLVHSESGLALAKRITEILFDHRLHGIGDLDENDLNILCREVPGVQLSRQALPISAISLALKAGCFDDVNTAERTINQGGFHVNNFKITNTTLCLTGNELYSLSNLLTVLRIGRRKHFIYCFDESLAVRSKTSRTIRTLCASRNIDLIGTCRVLVIGAGGLGCELLKDLALSGFRNIHVIDMDTIDLSNLNRQFLFRQKDIGKSKAIVAAEAIERRLPFCSVTPHFCRIEEKPLSFYESFAVIVAGLDSISARRWINRTLVRLLRYDDKGELDMASVIPLVDGGTEGFKGSVRVILPGLSPCVECLLELYPPPVQYQLCTIANTPRSPEHCIEYVKRIAWSEKHPFGDMEIDGDNEAHIQWIYNEAVKRAGAFGIHGVTIRLTKGVIKNIIPAVSSTNAVIAAACALEVFKLVSSSAMPLENYMNFQDGEGIYMGAVLLERDENCELCSRKPITLTFNENDTLENVCNVLKTDSRFEFTSPSITYMHGTCRALYVPSLPGFENLSRGNLTKTLKELGLMNGEEIYVSDPSLKSTLTFRLSILTAAQIES